MAEKKPTFDEWRHKLETDMLQASSLKTEPERRGFVNRTFLSIHKAYQGKQVSHAEYVKLINRLGGYKPGEFNDYIDMLAGAAQLNMLEMVIQGEVPQLEPEQARQRRQAITDLTGVEPQQPDSEQ